MSASKDKGKRLEDVVAKIIREAYGVSAKYVHRAATSGVKADEEADVQIIHPYIEQDFPFVIECKNQERWKLKDLIGSSRDNKTNPFAEYIQQDRSAPATAKHTDVCYLQRV